MRSSFIVAMVGMVVGLVLLGWRVSAATEAIDDVKRATGATAGAAIAQAEQAAAMVRVQQAVSTAEAWIAEQGGAASLTTDALRALDPSLDPTVSVTPSGEGYCVEATFGSTTAHATGPLAFGSGPCP